jgi:hypothetical protein
MKRFGLVLLVALMGACAVLAAPGAPVSDEELLGPFPSWLDVKRDFGAVGDGKADDTDALQKALDSVGNQTLGKSAIWFPAGTYRITRTLVRIGVSGVFLIGEHPDTTVIRWDGPAYDHPVIHQRLPGRAGAVPGIGRGVDESGAHPARGIRRRPF